jgi:hypothetical protein
MNSTLEFEFENRCQLDEIHTQNYIRVLFSFQESDMLFFF